MAQLVARLVRNEKVGGSNPPSSTTGRHPIVDVGFLHAGRVVVVPVVVLVVAPLVFLARHVLSCGPGCSVCPWAAARPLAVSAVSFARRVVSNPARPRHRSPALRPGPAAAHGHLCLALPPPTGTAAVSSGPSGAHRHRGRSVPCMPAVQTYETGRVCG